MDQLIDKDLIGPMIVVMPSIDPDHSFQDCVDVPGRAGRHLHLRRTCRPIVRARLPRVPHLRGVGPRWLLLRGLLRRQSRHAAPLGLRRGRDLGRLLPRHSMARPPTASARRCRASRRRTIRSPQRNASPAAPTPARLLDLRRHGRRQVQPRRPRLREGPVGHHRRRLHPRTRRRPQLLRLAPRCPPHARLDVATDRPARIARALSRSSARSPTPSSPSRRRRDGPLPCRHHADPTQHRAHHALTPGGSCGSRPRRQVARRAIGADPDTPAARRDDRPV